MINLLAEFDPRIIGLVVPLSCFFFVVAIVAIKKATEIQRQKLWHETARLALEKGQPVPLPPVATSDDEEKKAPRNAIGCDVRSGLILLAVGAGLYLGSRAANFGPGLFAFYIPLLIGAALLLNAAFTAFFNSKEIRDSNGTKLPKA